MVGRRGDNANVFLISGLGSRGLLYHAYLAKRLAEAVLANVRKMKDALSLPSMTGVELESTSKEKDTGNQITEYNFIDSNGEKKVGTYNGRIKRIVVPKSSHPNNDPLLSGFIPVEFLLPLQK